MAREYVSRVRFLANGQEITDFDQCTETEREVRTPVNLMGRTGFVKRTQRYGLRLNYLIPANGDEHNFEGVENGTVIVEYEGGRRILYSGVSCMTIGEATFNEENAGSREITFGADSRKEE